MPKVDGFAVLDYMKENNLLTKMPVSIISGDSSKETIDKLKKKDVSYMIGNNFRKGISHTDDTKKQIRNTLIENAKKPDYINGMTGRFGENNPFFGKKHSKMTR